MKREQKITKRDFIKSSCALCAISVIPFSAQGLLSRFPETNEAKSDTPWKWSTKAHNFVNTPKGIRCITCPNECEIKPGETGDCRTHEIFNGTLYNMAYGNPCAVNVDPVEKKPLYHFFPGSKAFSIATAGCNLACLNCQNYTISQFSPRETRNYDLMPAQTVEMCMDEKCTSIAYTYSDPVAFFEYTKDTSRIARSKGIKNIIVSAGYINEQPLRDWCRYIDAANIDLKSFSEQIYAELNGGKLQPVLNTLKILRDEGVWLEITNLVVPGWTDNLDMIKEMCEWLVKNNMDEYPLHFSRFHPMYKLTHLPSTSHATLKKAKEIARNAGLKYVYIGNVPGEDQNTYCPTCHKAIVERIGYTIIKNDISGGKCPSCQTKIAGVWS